MNNELAYKILEAAKNKAMSLNVAVSIAVLDPYAHLVLFLRLDGSILGSIDLAIGKAKTSALFQMSSESLKGAIHPDGPAPSMQLSNSGLFTFAGGCPVYDIQGNIVGAVGVSGGTVDQDGEIAEFASKA
jgi:uncharacterized protein GlcG (DUF336 family)